MKSIRCKVCMDTGIRVAVDAALLGRHSERDVARQFGITSSSVHRHKTKCLGRALDLVIEDNERVHANLLQSEINHLAGEAKRLQEAAEKAGDTRTALLALRELRGLLELRTKTFDGPMRVRNAKNVNIAVVYGDGGKRNGNAEVSGLPEKPA